MAVQKFEFSDHRVPVEIAGQPYSVDCSTSAQAFILEQNTKLKSMIEDIKHGKATEQDAVALVKQTFDRIIGEGAVDSIFSGREVTADDVADLSLFIRDVYTRYNSDRDKKIAGTPAKKRK